MANSGIMGWRSAMIFLRLAKSGSHFSFSTSGASWPSTERVIWLSRSSIAWPPIWSTFMTPNRSCKRAATSDPRGDLLGARVPSRSKTKSFLMVFLQVAADCEAKVHRPSTTLNESQNRGSWTLEMIYCTPLTNFRAETADRKICRAADSIGCEASRETDIRRFKIPGLEGTLFSWPPRHEPGCAGAHRARRCHPRPPFDECRCHCDDYDHPAADHRSRRKRLHARLSGSATHSS